MPLSIRPILSFGCRSSRPETIQLPSVAALPIENIVATTDSVCSNAKPSQVSVLGSIAALRWKLSGVPRSVAHLEQRRPVVVEEARHARAAPACRAGRSP